MSKEHTPPKHTNSARLKTGLGILLLCLPLVPPAEAIVPGTFMRMMLLTALGAGIATEILRRLPPFAANRPRVLWSTLLLPLALPRVFPIFPAVLEACLYLLPLLLLSRTARQPRSLHLALAFAGSAALTLWIGQTDGPALSALLPGILFLFLPLALCLRKPWHFFAFPAAATSLALLLLTLHLTPLHYWQTTARMTTAEARERAPGTAPAPRYRPAPDAPPALPGDFSPQLVALIHARQTALSRPALRALFENAPLPPDEMIRALRVYGFIQHDRHGFHIPSEAFTLDPAEHLAPDYLLWVEKLRAHAGINPETLSADLLREARRNEVLLPVRPGSALLRFSANHRARLANELLPRQILTLLDLGPDTPPLTAETYARTWDLPLTAAEAELRNLYDTGHLEPVRWQARDVRPPPVTLPDANRGLRILLRIALAALGLHLLRACPGPLRKNLHILGGLSVWGFTATELAASAQTLPAASLLALWLTPVSLILLTAALWVRPSER
ncbi:MAG: hypothetical protein JJU05_11285 [Verrucomicrobia bacterium]|nr:hypothetical protein [Verrucomicrobiota bacterium]MCH8527228.1 hypothetical protein [Kiritimatiellia bacterium]